MSNEIKIIREFGKQMGITLKEQPIEKLRTRGSFSLDRNGNVIGLNLRRLRRPDRLDISPLNELKHLAFLDLRNNKLEHILPISHFKNLTHLYLSNIQESDISPIKELTQLNVLYLSSNNLSDISPIKELSKLTVLHLGANKLSDISPIGDLKQLSKLDLGKNNLSSITHLKELKQLTKLILSNNSLLDISPLKELKQLTYLDLRSNKLLDISPIRELKRLTKLYLDSNNISDISPIAGLTELSHLFLSSNHISDISPFKKLTQLIQVNLGRNQLSDISPIKKLRKLKALDLRCNQLSDRDISPIKELKQLTDLDLSNNKLSNIFPLKELKQLTNLDLGNNNLSDISLLKDLNNLTHLCLSSNKISDISSIKELKHLTRLFLKNNRLSDISPIKELKNLTSLDLRNNKITHLFVELTHLNTDMEYWSYKADGNMLLSDNPLESPPIEIAVQGKLAIINYFKEIEESPVRLLESKLLIVGAGAVGKTTLMQKLKDNNFKVVKEEEATTHGINIEPWKLHCNFQTAESADVNIHFWDFGGQEIYHSTHQFFLTKRSLYLLVWEARSDEDKDFDYWFNVIKLLSDNSPVIVVMNKLDIRQKNLDEASFRERFKNIVNFFRVSCVTGEGIKELTEQIRKSLSRMPHLNDLLPTRWKDIRDQLYEKSEERDYISLKEYLDLCQSFELKEEQAKFLSDYLHDLGVILHFREDKVLEDTVILNPEWATEAVYRLIDIREINENKGRFEFDKLKDYWDGNKFPRSIHNELIRLMEKFDLCFNLQETDEYIIPELLPPERPPIHFDDYNNADNLRFEFHYNFMPAGIISRFICRIYYLIKNNHFWQNDVELKVDSAVALVTSERFNKKIKISISGYNMDQLQLLGIIRKEFLYIHKKLNLRKDDRDYWEMIPCNCSTCIKSSSPHLFKHDVLQRYSEKGISLIRCDESLEEVPIEQLLKGFESKPFQEDLLQTIIITASQFQGVAKNIPPDEDGRNKIFALLLDAKRFIVKDQSRWGISATSKSMGRLDIKIENSKGKALAIIETFNLKGFDKNCIDLHLIKLFGYDPNGLEKNFIIVYSEGNDFSGLWKKYLDNIDKIDFKFPLKSSNSEETGFSEIKLAKTTHMREDKEVSIYHLFINMKPK
ncbi:MAG: internalin [Acidobacteriota bacterium]|nr:internalin [Acidobacteriota bacterium]